MLIGKAQVNRNRTSLILVEQIVIVLLTTFSDLDIFVESLGTDEKMKLLDRIRWATKTSTIKEHIEKLQVHKSTLTLMMTILTCESMRTAEDAVDSLSTTIQRFLESNTLIAERLTSIEVGLGVTTAPSRTFTGLDSTQPAPADFQRNTQGFAFEEELSNSWVYKRSVVRSDEGTFSIISSAGRTASWSMLSGLSLADNISIIAVQALPIYEQDLSNSDLYSFGDFNSNDMESSSAYKTTAEKQSPLNKIASPSKALRSWWDRRTTSPAPQTPQANSSSRIFGVSLKQSVQYANAAINLRDKQGNRYKYGHLPFVVTKVGRFLKQNGTTCEDIFARKGSAVRVHELEVLFDAPPMGKGFNWTGYSAYDAATCLLRYLKRLPEPVIPYDFYEKFTSILGPTVYENDEGYDRAAFSVDSATLSLQKHIIELEPLNRQLLLYILDLAAVFASKSDQNKMTTRRIVAAFQPSLLSREPGAGMSVVDHVRAADTVAFLIENRDYFLIGMKARDPNDDMTTTTE